MIERDGGDTGESSEGKNIDLRKAVVLAAQAASVANTQPWHFEISADHVDVYADRSVQLGGLDPVGRQLVMSVGCALFNARVAIASAGGGAKVTLFPELDRPDLLARLAPSDNIPIESIGYLGAQTDKWYHPNLFQGAVPAAHLRPILENAAEAEGASIAWIDNDAQRDLLIDVTAQADLIQEIELRQVPTARVPEPGYAVLVAQAALGGLMILATEDDDPRSWLHAGQALQRLILELYGEQLVVLPLGGPTEIPLTRAAVRAMLGGGLEPMLILLVGHSPPAPQPRRRRLIEILTEH